MNINARGLFFSQRAEVSAMLQTKATSSSDGFSIVNISSIGGLRALAPYSSPYVPSKHAVIGLTKSAGSSDRFPYDRAFETLTQNPNYSSRTRTQRDSHQCRLPCVHRDGFQCHEPRGL